MVVWREKGNCALEKLTCPGLKNLSDGLEDYIQAHLIPRPHLKTLQNKWFSFSQIKAVSEVHIDFEGIFKYRKKRNEMLWFK